MEEILAGRYELIRRLGAGGNAEVFEAVDRQLERSVAVKRVHVGAADPRAAERLAREACAAARVVHPNVVRVYDTGTDDRGKPFVVVELVDGPSLAAVLAERGRLLPRQALRVADEVLAGLGAVHAQGLVHRDVKPGNVLVTSAGHVKLADFGIARDLSATSSLTAAGQVIGTAAYISPEQVAGQPATPQSDLYAVGVLLYEMLTGSTPFAGDGPAAVALAHRDGTVPRLAVGDATLPAALIDTLDRALAKDPARRPADAAAMRESLAGVFAPAAEPAPAPAAAAGRRRRRWPVMATAAALLALVTGVAAGARSGSGGGEADAGTTTVPTATTAVAAPLPPTTVVEDEGDGHDKSDHGHDDDEGD